jgi:hypothetical protein
LDMLKKGWAQKRDIVKITANEDDWKKTQGQTMHMMDTQCYLLITR